MAVIKAGFSKVDITPRVGVELCGFGPYLNRHSTRVIEPLYARAMAVEMNGERWVLMSADVIAFNAKLTTQIRTLVRASTGLRDEQIMVHATHTHAGPCTIPELLGWGDPDDPYLEMLPRFVAKACADAIKDLKEATFHHAEVDAIGFGYNRELLDEPSHNELAIEGNSKASTQAVLQSSTPNNELVLEGKWKTNKPEETDTTAHVFRVDRDGKTAGFLTYFSCHPIVCCEYNHEIHGDFVGLATNRIEKEYPGAIGLFLQGAEGDINPSYVHGPSEQSLLALEAFASRFAEVIRQGMKAAKPFEVTKIGSVQNDEPYTLASVSRDKLAAMLAEFQQVLANADLSKEDYDVQMAMVYTKSLRAILARLDRGEEDPGSFAVQSFRLGPFTFTATAFEMMHRIKRRFQAEMGNRALPMSVTNGFLGYAPLRDLYHHTPQPYPVAWVPYMLGRVPYTDNIEDEVLAAIVKVTKMV